ncbi:P-loop containing nucleoside triphosphate hydrolase protein [Lentithecium fluviatile CBS 122367]|uniref:RNA helicase n=1 Tax=Lentithecium fluviatile CBS 122367 TaxID=1168545 RepID=A0A6G1IVV3_9PLEO|nr:P-loop containing nucleoside triphosphate hydrolase protein [Lentithecium fluviatile CBS 122367]
MPVPLTQRSSLCLFCAFAARPRAQPQRLLPRVQVAYRTGGHTKKPKQALDFEHVRDIRARKTNTFRGEFRRRSSFNPLSSTPSGFVSPFQTVRIGLERLKAELSQPEYLESLQLTRETFDQEWLSFERSVNLWIKQASPELERLTSEAHRGRRSLESRLRYLFYAQTCGGRFTKAELDNQKEVADLRYPTEWYPATREIPRTVHLHVGPTNSGKTYHALKRLEEAERGIYLGPLRLLAHEVYTRLNAKGKPCALVTGEEQRLPKAETKMWSCTVEMAPLNADLDVAVIDEIQMISHKERGWAWTQAFLGVKAKELHLCGEARTVPLIRELCALVGDKVHVHEYERLTPLEVAPRSLRGKLDTLEKGDCIVAFSVLGIHALRREVEKKTGKKCAIVYGSLPPETRAQQARLFNDPDNDYDFLVASDAIGMGLNLSIKRVIFESTVKSNGTKLVPLEISEIKQIAGRAGRYKTAHQAVTQDESQKAEPEPATEVGAALDGVIKPDAIKCKAKSEPRTVGIVTTLEQLDFEYLKAGMNREPESIRTAGLFPPSLIIERFASYFPPGTPFSYIMLRLHEISSIHPRFHLCGLKDQLTIADTIHTVKNLSITDRIMICAAPTNMRDVGEQTFLRSLAECIADNKSGNLLELEGLPLERLDKPPSGDRKYLYELEQLHKMIVTYLWLSYRFPHVFTTRALANHVKQIVEDAIERTLTQFSWTQQAKEAIMKKRKEAMRELKEQENNAVYIEGEQEDVERTKAATARNIPQAVEDVLHDESSFVEHPAPADDEGEYPTEELEVLEPTETERLDQLEKEYQERTRQLSNHAQDSLRNRIPPPIGRSEASQPIA